MDQSKIGKFIATLRKNKNLTQKEIANKLGISEKTVSKWECGNGLPEVIYMEPLCEILGITVNELLTGEHISFVELLGKLDQTRIEIMKQLEFQQLKMRIYKLYRIEIDSMEYSENGAGSLVYFVCANEKKYVVKYPSDNCMNNPELEPEICAQLLKKKISVCDFVANKQGGKISVDENGRRFSIQRFYSGKTFNYHEAPVKLQEKSAQMLARIHIATKDMIPFPVGIGEQFFQYRKPEYMEETYKQTLELARLNNDTVIVDRIKTIMKLIEKFPKYTFDISKFTVGNTHGDYMISQIVWDNDEIMGVIDWTTACRHPYIWEIVRSYVFMAPECKNGEINIEALINYIKSYMKYGFLNAYDIENSGKLFYYFFAVCNFYGQYYNEITKNRYIYLQQADMAYGLMKWFEQHIDELDKELKVLCKSLKLNSESQ